VSEMPGEVKTCKRCGKPFKRSPLAKYCSNDCRWRTHGPPWLKRDRAENPRRAIYHRARQNAKIWNREFNLTVEDIPEIPEFCPVFPWIKISHVTGEGRTSKNPSEPSIDRIDPSKGYVKGNVRIISWRANEVRGNGTLREFEALVEDQRKLDI
jgi:hypothetical protein